MVMCGEVMVNGETLRFPRIVIPEDSIISLKIKDYVSRGGVKLEFALKKWNIGVAGKVFIDVGASTGGFTHCLLKHGAENVHAVDVGYNLIDYSLRQDSRVLLHERINIMDVKELFPEPQAAVVDLSFRSITGAASHILNLVSEKWLIALIKPQFEWQDPDKRFRGVIKDKGDLLRVMKNVVDSLWEEKAFVTKTLPSPIKGRKGNVEFLFLIQDSEDKCREEILERLKFAVKTL